MLSSPLMSGNIKPVEWTVSSIHVPYLEAVWLMEHLPLYTAGTSAKERDLLDARFPTFKSGRGGQYTYHGPGQRVGYVMLDLKRRGADIRCYVHQLEAWLIRALSTLGV